MAVRVGGMARGHRRLEHILLPAGESRILATSGHDLLLVAALVRIHLQQAQC